MKKIIPILIVLVIVGGGTFYGGMKYGESKSPLTNSGQNFQNLSPEERQQLFQGNVAGSVQRGVARGTGAGPEGVASRPYGVNFLNGEVIDKDEQTLTLKMPDGSSKIIFFSDSTEISKTTDGSIGDIEIGKQITVTGDQNSDGSYTAKTIQLRAHNEL